MPHIAQPLLKSTGSLRAMADLPYCLLCEKGGHRTDECWSTHGLNTPRDQELFRLARLASPGAATREGEPAGYLAFQEGDGKGVFFPTMVHMTSGTLRWHPPVSRVVPLYTTPPAPTTEPTAKPITGLTEEEIERLAVKNEAFGFGLVDAKGFTTHGFDPDGLGTFVQAITRALAEKNGLAVQGDGK